MTFDKEEIKKFRFRNFPVYKDALRFKRDMKGLAQKFPKEEKFALTSQFFRALDSIILNIAEGADRTTDKDFALFLNYSHTSLNESVACLDIALLQNYISGKEHEIALTQAESLANQLTAFRKKVLIDNQ